MISMKFERKHRQCVAKPNVPLIDNTGIDITFFSSISSIIVQDAPVVLGLLDYFYQ